jgi:hypothetical protein
MSVTPEDIEMMYDIVKPAFGLKVWDVHRLFGSCVAFSLRQAIEDEDFYITGEWHFYIDNVAWRLETPDDVVAGSEDHSEEVIDVALQQLENKTLLSVEITLPCFDTIIRFEDDFILRLFPRFSEESRHWEFFTPGHKVLIIGPGSNWDYRASNVPYS